MSTIVHAHDVMNWLGEQNEPVSLETLQTALEHQYGKNLLFTNCSEQHFSFEQIISFMQQRNKITINEQGISLNKAMMCNH